jgi:hypothetical protein
VDRYQVMECERCENVHSLDEEEEDAVAAAPVVGSGCLGRSYVLASCAGLEQGYGSAACVGTGAHLGHLNALANSADLGQDYGSAVYVVTNVRLGNLCAPARSADLAAPASSHAANVEMGVHLDMLYVPANSPDLGQQSCGAVAG